MTSLLGLTASTEHIVADHDTASALGSGSLDVLGTPRLLAWLENSTVKALADHLPPGTTSVGTEVSLRHLRATAVGDTICITSEVTGHEGRSVDFTVDAKAADGTCIASGTVRRAIVDVDRFLRRL
ncbi:thioesterase family protein [Nocardia vaccinii]|uniref:thioesterase family protein n=1 Tax=Nocardia vaccinii TaxID=1822 RepID=UPI0008362FE7|nr:hotdog domain-containing protein [Nocardia vaccinii]